MSEIIPQRELRNDVSAVLRRVAQGESFTITVRGEPVAEIVPIRRPRRFVPRERVTRLLEQTRDDPDLLAELRAAQDDGADDQGRDRVDRLFGS